MNKKIIIGVFVAAFTFGLASIASAFTIGSRGSDVTDLQIQLIEAGYDIPALTSGGAAFGYYGVQTDSAYRAYQASQSAKSPVLGAVSNPDLQSQFFSFGGVRQWAFKDGTLTRAASTTCTIQLPAATTTLIFASLDLTTIASTTVAEIGYDRSSAYATTTLIARKTITAATKDTLIPTSTPMAMALGNLTPPGTFAPNSFINFKIGGGSVAGTNDPAGTCSVNVREVR